MERAIFLVSLSAIVMVFLIFLFVGREGLPVLFGRRSSAAVSEIIPVADMDKTPPLKIQRYLGLTDAQVRDLDRATKVELMTLKAEGAQQLGKEKDAAINTLEWRYLLFPYQWTGYDHPASIWQPVSPIHKYNLVPLVISNSHFGKREGARAEI